MKYFRKTAGKTKWEKNNKNLGKIERKELN